MPEPIRVRIIEIVCQNGCEVKKNVSAPPYCVKDSVNISKEAFERFRAQGRQNLLVPPDGPDEEQNSHRAPELDKNLKTLNLNLGAKPERIRKAYLEAVKKYHPDKFSNHPPELVRAAEEKTKQINTAYSVLRKA